MSTTTVESLQILKYSLRNLRKRPQSIPQPIAQPTIPNELFEECDPSLTLEIMSRLGDSGWSHDAIIDVDT